MNWTKEQLAIMDAAESSPASLCIDAVAGSGKTATLVESAKRLNPRLKVLALAFNSKIKEELSDRLPSHITTSTLNGLGHRAWQKYTGRKLIVSDRKVGKIVSDLCKEADLGDAWDSVRRLVSHAKAVGLAPSTRKNIKPLVEDTQESWEELFYKHDVTLEEGVSIKAAIQLARSALDISITEALSGIIDFDDQLYMTCIFGVGLEKYDVVLVDEAQDLSEIQHTLVARSVTPKGRVIAFGDPKQAIYGFRGAATNSMDSLSLKFNMTHLNLTYSFRCPSLIVKEAQPLVPQIKPAPNAPAGEVLTWEEWSAEDIELNSVVLCRNVAPIVSLGFKFIRAGIPAYVLGRDMGKGLKKLAGKMSGRTGEDLLRSIREWESLEKANARGKQDLELEHRIGDQAETLAIVVIQSKANSPEELILGLSQLFDKTSGSITLSTIHRAKGLEWNTVYFLDPWRVPAKFAKRAVENDPLNCAWMMEQENNLRYIAITRSKNKLIYIYLDGRKEESNVSESIASE